MLLYAGKSMVHVQLELEVYGVLGNPDVLILPLGSSSIKLHLVTFGTQVLLSAVSM